MDRPSTKRPACTHQEHNCDTVYLVDVLNYLKLEPQIEYEKTRDRLSGANDQLCQKMRRGEIKSGEYCTQRINTSEIAWKRAVNVMTKNKNEIDEIERILCQTQLVN